MSDIKGQAKQMTHARREEVSEKINDKAAAILEVIPKHINGEAVLKRTLSVIRENDGLLECSMPSLVGSVYRVMQLGLVPNSSLEHCYLIPFKNRKKENTECQIVIGYRGFIALAHNNPNIISWEPYTVFENDEFEIMLGTEQKLIHRPTTGEQGKAVCYYSVAKSTKGGHSFRYMTVADVNRIRTFSSQPDSDPWRYHFDAMAMKSVLRQHHKYMPLQTEQAEAIALDDMDFRGESQNNASVLTAEYTKK